MLADGLVRGHLFLEASAGTGKTYTIEHLVARLLTTEPVMTLDQILVITFTKAATRELRQRIHQTLQKTLASTTDQTTFLRLERACALIEEAPIYTIHSFCRKMLSAYPFDAKISLDPLNEEEDGEKLLDILRSLKPYEEFSPHQLSLVLQKQGRDINKLCRALKGAEPVTAPSFQESWETSGASMTKEDFDQEQTADPEVTLARLASYARSKMRLSPDDFLTTMQECLAIPSFVQKVRGRFGAAIIDEFQDTDPVQWEIFHKLFIEQPLPFLCLVGDPKQSIYGFRKADLRTFLKAKSLFTPQILSTNYRSHPLLIDALNWLFDNRSEWLGKDIAYIPVNPRDNYLSPPIEDGKGCLHFLLAKGTKGRARKWPTETIESTLFFPKIAQEIQSLALSYGQIAILVKDRFQAHRLALYLQSQHIPTMTKDRSNLLETKAFFLLYNFLRENSGASWNVIEAWIDTFPSLDDYQDLMQLVEIAIEENFSPEELARWMSKDSEEEPKLRRKHFTETDHVHIMTTHAAKGLEFDVVFALGLLSRQQEENSSLEEEKMRLLYVACTRAKRRLYLPVCDITDEKKRPQEGLSPIELFLSKVFPQGDLKTHLQESGKSITFEELEETTLLPPTPKAPPLLIPPLAITIPHTPFIVQSFSSAHQKQWSASPAPSSLPKGAKVGTFFHNLFETILFKGIYDDVPFLTSEIEKSPFAPWKDEIITLVTKTLSLPLEGFTLKDIPPSHMLQEMEFLFEDQGIYWKGFADLVFHHQDRYYLLDWKLHLLENYEPATLARAIQEGCYESQASLYAKALSSLIPEGSFGGAFYLFVRGPAVHILNNFKL